MKKKKHIFRKVLLCILGLLAVFLLFSFIRHRVLPSAFIRSLKSDDAAAKDSQKQPYQDVYELNWAMRYLRSNT